MIVLVVIVATVGVLWAHGAGRDPASSPALTPTEAVGALPGGPTETGTGLATASARSSAPRSVIPTAQPTGVPAVAPEQVSDLACSGASPGSRELILEGSALRDGTVITNDGAVLLSRFDHLRFDFASEPAALAVIVRAGDTENLYRYERPMQADRGLVGPISRTDGSSVQISRISFCLSAGVAAGSTPPVTASASPVTAETAAAGLRCEALDPALHSLTIDGAALANGAVTDGVRGATISDLTPGSFTFSSHARFAAVIVDGSTSANLYRFEPPVTSGDRLSGPTGQPIRAISLCYGGG